MEKVYIHIGLSLFAIKKLCDSQETCTNCPLWDFCKSTHSLDSPDDWDFNTFPNVAVILELTDSEESDTIKISSPD